MAFRPVRPVGPARCAGNLPEGKESSSPSSAPAARLPGPQAPVRRTERLCDVVIPRTRLDELTYDCAGLAGSPGIGDCVEVRLRSRKAYGIIVGFPAASRVRGLRPVERLVEPAQVHPGLLKLADWVADYYCCFRGEALTAVLPGGLAGRVRGPGEEARVKGEGTIEGPGRLSSVSCRPAASDLPELSRTPTPAGQPVGFGVEVAPARSGRLELVAGFLEAAVQRGGGILLLPEAEFGNWLPELRRRFGPALVVYHSRLGRAGLRRAWREARDNDRRLVAGVRSAVFAPVRALGGIAVIDAHDPVFKEERYPRYNARDVAVVRARMAGCPVLLSDPLPAVETWHSVSTGQYRLRGSLPESGRYPASYIVDLRRSRERVFSPRLRRELEKLPADAAAMLYVNRKGLSRRVACNGCGAALECEECRLPLALTAGRRLACGWCGTDRPAPETCPVCGGASFDLRAAGVELVARELGRLCPGREIARVESGIIRYGERGEGSSDRAIGPCPLRPGVFAVGTRALLGIEWPRPVGLVAVVNLDYDLALPDHRVRERTFAMLGTLVARAEAAGAALVVQTRRPEEPVLDYGLSRDITGFMGEELELRREAGLPPWRRLALVEIGGGTRGAVLTRANQIMRSLNRHRGVEALGPADARQGRTRLLVRFPRGASLGKLLDKSLLSRGHLRVQVDVDPKDTF